MATGLSMSPQSASALFSAFPSSGLYNPNRDLILTLRGVLIAQVPCRRSCMPSARAFETGSLCDTGTVHF